MRRRALHDIPPLRTRIDQDLTNFLPPAYKVVAPFLDEGLSIVDTIICATPERSFVLAFNYASSTTTSSLAQLKSAFSAAAMGMFTNGYIWFITDTAGNTAVIPTFGPGTLLVRSQTYMGHSKLLMGSGMLQYDRGDPLMKGDPYM
ncbi:hypothetical protein D9758_016946 [Tetrapyrgos nigripes]|uniref:Uncharacterized protein n=1 Tax=Tetrapyrgos nigripes TaxID=182062 RepID=A0A8H5C0D9_9AGAR|nr:hypothetical protein D9758_016946 [Tetrapyrgos nigripes]